MQVLRKNDYFISEEAYQDLLEIAQRLAVERETAESIAKILKPEGRSVLYPIAVTHHISLVTVVEDLLILLGRQPKSM